MFRLGSRVTVRRVSTTIALSTNVVQVSLCGDFASRTFIRGARTRAAVPSVRKTKAVAASGASTSRASNISVQAQSTLTNGLHSTMLYALNLIG